jgi:hypothetical protein
LAMLVNGHIICIVGVESSWVHSAWWPLIAWLYLPLVIVMMENLVEWRLAGDTEVFGENPPQRHFAHHKSTWPDLGSNPGRRDGNPATNRLSYGAAKSDPFFDPSGKSLEEKNMTIQLYQPPI